MADIVTVLLRFSVPTTLGMYQDTFVFTEDEYAHRDPDKVETDKQNLADKWVIFRKAQIQEEDALRTHNGKVNRIAELTVQIADLTATKTSLEGSL